MFAYYETDWDKDGLHWAAFGMEDVTKLASDTDNLVERFNLALNMFVWGREHYRLARPYQYAGCLTSMRTACWTACARWEHRTCCTFLSVSPSRRSLHLG